MPLTGGVGNPTLTFQFADGQGTGTYADLSARLTWRGFDDTISVIIRGNTGDGEYDPGTTDPSVILYFAAGVTSNAIHIADCSAYVVLRNLEVDAPGITTYAGFISISRCKYAYVYQVVADAPVGDAYDFSFYYGSNGTVKDSWVSKGSAGIFAAYSCTVIVRNCSSFNTAPMYGIDSTLGSYIGKYEKTANLPNGTAADYRATTGGIYTQPKTIDY